MIAFVLASALIGSQPSLSLQATIKESVGKKLADPFSAQYQWQTIKSEIIYCGWVNAKNQFGAFMGYQPFMVLYAVNKKSGQAMVLDVDFQTSAVTPMCLKEGYHLTP